MVIDMRKKPVYSVYALLLSVILIFTFVFSGCAKTDVTDPEQTPPSGNGVVNTPPIPGSNINLEGYTLLAGLSQHDPTVPAQSPQLPDRSYIRPTSGVFSDESRLTAWDNNTHVLIGATDSSIGASVVLYSGSLTSRNWISAQTSGIFNASGFQISFSTLGYENIRFSVHQQVSGDFGDAQDTLIPFEASFSTSGGVRWTAIHNSGVTLSKGDLSSQTYDNFRLSTVVADEEEVIVRIYLNSASNITGNGSISINNIRIIGDVIGSSVKDIVLMELVEENENAAAMFFATPEDAFYGATNGLEDSDFRLTGWDRSRPRFIGYTGETQTPIVFENIMTTRNWTAADGNIADATAFQIQLRTLGYEDILFTAGQVSSADGPDIFKLAYSLDEETWIPIADSTTTVSQTLALSYNRFLLPPEVSSKESVFLRIYFDGESTGVSTSINDIEIWGKQIASYDGFKAEMLTIQPGATNTQRNITWHDWVMTGTSGKVRFEQLVEAANGFTAGAVTVDAISTDSYIRRVSHSATISGLMPDTQYYYAVSGDGVNFSEMYTFKTSPADSFTFVALSDVHMGDPSVSPEDDDSGNGGMLDIKYRPGVTTRQGWLDALDVVTGIVPNVSLIAIMGDVVDRNLIDLESEPDIHPHLIKWQNYMAPMQMSSIPIAPVMGNHEGRMNIAFRIHFNLPNEIIPSEADMLPMASTGIQRENENMANYWYVYNNALFVVLNTSTRPRDANENATQDAIIQGIIAHYDSVLETAKAAHAGQYDWLFVQTHKSISNVGKHSADFDVERYVRFGLEELFAKHEVDIVFTAHEHCYSRSFPLLLNPGADNFGPDIDRSDFRMNNVSYDFENGGNSIRQGDGTVLFSMNSISGQKFYVPFAPEFFNNENYPYLYDGTRGALNMSLSPDHNVFLSADIETFGPRIPWNIAHYRQEYKPMFLELTVTAESVEITVYEFAHDVHGTLLSVDVVDNLTITK